jgi:NAD(P)-dependent dehydrogenase (short-subunit alcohol dehydrogenase family)
MTDSTNAAGNGRVAGKTALVTGGASGIGQATAQRLAAEGAYVLVTDVDDDLGESTVAAISAAGGRAGYQHHDVTEEAQWESVMAHLQEASGGLHILVNNAGIGIGGSLLEMSLEDWRRQQAINLDGVFLGLKHGIPLIRDSGGGSIINISSVAGLKGSANLSAYCATKGGVRLLTKGAALECAQNRWGVRVNSVHPGVIDTPIWTKVNPAALEEGANAVDLDAMAELGVPMGIPGRPEEIAAGVLFLASDDSSYMTGSELVIDGGITA